MPPASHLLAFTLTAFVLIAAPGPSVLFTVSRALALGRVAGVATVAGNTAGFCLQVLAVAFGIGALAERSVLVFNLIKLVGAGYLIVLGVQAIRHRKRLGEALGARLERKSTARIVADGFVVGVGNPKVIVFLAAVLPQFADRAAGHLTTQLLVLGLLFAGIATVCDSGWALAAGSARAWLGRSPRRLELIGGTGGLVMIGLGATLAVSGRHD
jgi:threonine/homoserine/homoserine lactone efflux protein